MKRVSDWLDHLIVKTCLIGAVLIPVLMGVIVLQVVLRYGFSSGIAALEELQWHLYGAAIMMGLSYSHIKKSMIRVDLIYSKLSMRKKAIIDVTGTIVLLIPFLFVVLDHSIDFFHDSWRLNERSDSPEGLPFRWIIKGVMPVSIMLLILASVSSVLRDFSYLRNNGN